MRSAAHAVNRKSAYRIVNPPGCAIAQEGCRASGFVLRRARTSQPTVGGQSRSAVSDGAWEVSSVGLSDLRDTTSHAAKEQMGCISNRSLERVPQSVNPLGRSADTANARSRARPA